MKDAVNQQPRRKQRGMYSVNLLSRPKGREIGPICGIESMDENRRQVLGTGTKYVGALLLAPAVLSLTACGGGGGEPDSGGGSQPPEDGGGDSGGGGDGGSGGGTPAPETCEPKTFTYSTPGTKTHTVPAACKVVKIEVLGASGGAGGTSSNNKKGARGYRGENRTLQAYNVSPGQVFEVLIGSRGNSANGKSGGSGGTSPLSSGSAGKNGTTVIASTSGGGGGGGGASAVRLNGAIILRGRGGNGGNGAASGFAFAGKGGSGGSGGYTASGVSSSINGRVRFIYG